MSKYNGKLNRLKKENSEMLRHCNKGYVGIFERTIDSYVENIEDEYMRALVVNQVLTEFSIRISGPIVFGIDTAELVERLTQLAMPILHREETQRKRNALHLIHGKTIDFVRNSIKKRVNPDFVAGIQYAKAPVEMELAWAM